MARWRRRRSGESNARLAPAAPDAGNTEADGTAPAAELEIWKDERGVLLTGPPIEVEALVHRLTTIQPGEANIEPPTVLADALAVFASGRADGATLPGTASSYVQFTPRSLALLSEHGAIPAEGGAFRSMVHDGTAFAGNLDWQPADLASQRSLVMQTTAIGVALRLAVKEVGDAVARVEGQVDRLVAMVRAERLGNAVGDHRTLEAMVANVRAGHGLPSTDWSSIAALGPVISRDLEALRSSVRLTVSAAASSESSRSRAQAGVELLGDGLLAESLAALLVAEHNFAQWQELRLEHIGTEEPHHLEASVTDAQRAINVHAEEDQALLDDLAAASAQLFQPRLRDGLAPVQTRRIEQREAELHVLLTQFADQRTLDLDLTDDHDRPSPVDVARHAAGAVARASTSTTRQVINTGASLTRRRRSPAELAPGETAEGDPKSKSPSSARRPLSDP